MQMQAQKAKPNILFVDDEERLVSLLQMIFRKDYEVHTAYSGHAALDIVAQHPIDVIVSDQRMPGMQGIELLSEMRKRYPATMRILLTGYSDLDAIVGSVNEGEVFRFINKPWNHNEIKRIVAEAAEAASLTAATIEVERRHQPNKTMAMPVEQEALPGVLLIDDNPFDRQAIFEALNSHFTVYQVASVTAALGILEENNIGVIISEARVGGKDIGEFLRLLKRHHPVVTTVVLTHEADSDLVVKLINTAQIFRFGTKPVRASAFRLIIQAAMREHRRMQMNPVLTQRHRVEAPAVAETETESLSTGILSSLARMRAKFGALMGMGGSRVSA